MSKFKHYTLDDAAIKLSLSVDQILQKAESGELTLSFRTKRSGEIFFDYKELTEQDGESFLSTVVENYANQEYELGAYINLTVSHAKELAIKKCLTSVDVLPPPEPGLYVSDDSRACHAYKISLEDIVIQNEELEAFEHNANQKIEESKPIKWNGETRYKVAKQIIEEHSERFTEKMWRNELWVILGEFDPNAFDENKTGIDAFFRYHNRQQSPLFMIKRKYKNNS